MSRTRASQDEDLHARLRRLHARYPERGVVSTAPAAKWDFGTVVGNGAQGALAFCRTRYEELVLSHEELFLPLFPFSGYLPVRPHFETIRRLVIEGRTDEAQRLVLNLKTRGNFPHYNTTDPFVGACSLDLRMTDGGKFTDYVRAVDFATGEALVAWQDRTGLFHRHFFVSRTDDAIIVRLRSPTGGRLDLALGLREIDYQPPTDPSEHDIYAKTIDRCEGHASPTRLVHAMHFKRRWDTQPVLGCACVARVVVRDGDAGVEQKSLRVRQASDLLLMIRIVPFRNGQTVDVDAVGDALDQIDPDYDALLASHARVHGEMFQRCRLRLSSAEQQARSGEQLQAGSAVGRTDPALVEKAFDASRYAIIASTGKLPPALQGVWTGTWKPRWSGDYTLNGNVQSMVAAALCGNHFECQQSLMDYLDSLMDDFRSNARELLGFRGPLIPWRSSTHGRTHYLAYRQYHHNFPGIFWFPGAAWFAQIYYDYYLYTGDQQFFAERLKPFLLDSVALYEDLLTFAQDGKYVIAPDSSAENENGDDIWMAPNPTMTIAAVKQLLRTVLRHARQLGASQTQVDRWREMLAKLPAYAIGRSGALKEWAWPGIENNEAHRHGSHLYPLWFGVDPEIAASQELSEACRLAIEARMAPRRAEGGGMMAFGYTQFGMAAAHLGDTPHAYESVEFLVNNYFSPVLVSQHNHDATGPDVMNVDISGGLPALIITMLVQSLGREQSQERWPVRLLPCLPDAWPDGSLTGVRCRGGFEIDIQWQEGRLKSATITSVRGEPVELLLGDRRKALDLRQGQQTTLTLDDWS